MELRHGFQIRPGSRAHALERHHDDALRPERYGLPATCSIEALAIPAVQLQDSAGRAEPLAAVLQRRARTQRLAAEHRHDASRMRRKL